MRLLYCCLICLQLAVTAQAIEPKFHYRADTDLKLQGDTITSWGKLDRIHGLPLPWKVRTNNAVKTVVRLDGHAAIWQAANQWGQLATPRTIIIYARVHAAGVICDGSTRAGVDPLRVTGDGSKWEVLRFERETETLKGLIIGADVATQNGTKCDIAEVLIFDQKLSDAEYQQHAQSLQKTWGQPTDLPANEQVKLAAPFAGLTTKVLCKNGDHGVHTYRIPGLATTNKGTLIAVFDLRYDNSRDLPGNIDVGMLRSTDAGETWSPFQRVLDYPDSGVGDPTVLVDQQTGRIFVVALWSKGNRAWFGSGPGLTPEETGQYVITSSDDDGVTWSKPVSITSQIKQPEWRLCFNGPGAGIQLRDGTLVIPSQFKDPKGVPHSCFISSTDHGATWKMSPPCTAKTSESQIAETKNGMLITLRDEGRSGQRKWQRWDGKAWSEPWLALPDPVCQASLLRHPDGTLLFCNPANEKSRRQLTVRESRDDGQNWSAGRVIDPGISMYSSMSLLPDGRVALLYEGASGLHFARFGMEQANLATLPEGRYETTGKFGWWPERHRQKVAESKKDIKLVFVGDSITQGWEKTGSEIWQKHYAPLQAANYGFAGDSTQHVLWRIQNGEFTGMDPHVIVLNIGTNNAKHGDFTPEQIAAGIKAVTNKLSEQCPRSQILLLSIFPRDALPDGEMRKKCNAVNALLPQFADGKRVHLLNINQQFLQADGTLSKEIAPDALHLSEKGYQIWADSMQPKLDELLNAPRPEKR
jgi:sialidase-1